MKKECPLPRGYQGRGCGRTGAAGVCLMDETVGWDYAD